MITRTYNEDPEFPDEDDPAYKAEIFESLLYMEVTPDELKDLAIQKQYRTWLKARKAAE